MTFPNEAHKSVAQVMKWYTLGWMSCCTQGVDRNGEVYWTLPSWENVYPPVFIIDAKHYKYLFDTTHLDAIMAGQIPVLVEPASDVTYIPDNRMLMQCRWNKIYQGEYLKFNIT